MSQIDVLWESYNVLSQTSSDINAIEFIHRYPLIYTFVSFSAQDI